MEKIFDNTQVAFSLKSDTELDRAYFLFKMIDSEPLVRIGTAVTNFALKANLPVEGLIRATVFDHFCGGVNEDDCITVVDKMFTKGVSSVLDYSVEGKEEEAQFDAALEMTLKTIEFAKERLAIPFAVFKPTGFGRFELYEKLGEKQSLTQAEQEEWDRVVASTFKRGVDFINIPTTLLSMVDASVGGKTGVDLGNLKNQIGVINVPQMVLIDTQYLETLSQSEMRSGLAEMLKHGLIYDASYWRQFLNLQSIDYADFDALIYRSVEIKNDIVIQDPTEKNVRKALNFGHTLGHAIESYFLESATKTTLLHGEAIAIGMILESYISLHKNLITTEEYSEIKTALKSIYDDVQIEENDIDPILELLIHDKKNEYGLIQFALIEEIGKIKINQLVENKLILDAFQDYKS